MRRRLSDHTIVTLLVLLLLAETGLLLAHMGLLPFFRGFAATDDTQVQAGRIVTVENDLRRRGVDSLVWEKSSESEPVYYHDSVLTLSQSAATLALKNDTQVHLAENTLVTIEPDDADHPGEIRLRFQRGGLRAQTGGSTANIGAEDWSVDIRTGSDIDLNRMGDVYEVFVRKGEARFDGRSGSRKLTANQMLQIHHGSMNELKIDPSLRFASTPPARLYTHEQSLPVPISWQGSASELVDERSGSQTQMAIASGQLRANLQLPLGRHTLYLRAQDKMSAPLEVQVWKAPVIHLLSPLPRDRVHVGAEISFYWTFQPGLSGYRFELRGDGLQLRQKLDDNSYKAKFSGEANAEWQVYGLDKDGYEIPPPYSYPIFIRENPFAAPKLKAPEIRRPATDGRGAGFFHFLQDWLLPSAQAETDRPTEAVFEWEPVHGADHYVIEISETPDFRHPLVTESVHKTHFIWRDFPKQNVYWRVAAGGHKGRMGIFSEVASVDLKNVTKDSAGGVRLRKAQYEKPRRKVATASPEPVEQKAALPTPAPSEAPKLKHEKQRDTTATALPDKKLTQGLTMAWKPGYAMWSGKGDGGAAAKMNGAVPVAFLLDARRQIHDDLIQRFQFDVSYLQFQPQPKSDYPFQSKLSFLQAGGETFWHRNSSRFGYGVVVHRDFGIHRSGNESIDVSPSVSFGPAIEGIWTSASHEYLGNVSALTSSAGQGFGTQQQMRWHFGSWMGGVDLEGEFIFRSGGSIQSISGSLMLGREF